MAERQEPFNSPAVQAATDQRPMAAAVVDRLLSAEWGRLDKMEEPVAMQAGRERVRAARAEQLELLVAMDYSRAVDRVAVDQVPTPEPVVRGESGRLTIIQFQSCRIRPSQTAAS